MTHIKTSTQSFPRNPRRALRAGEALTIAAPNKAAGVRELVAPNRQVPVLTLNLCECDLMWKKGPCRHDQVKDLKVKPSKI